MTVSFLMTAGSLPYPPADGQAWSDIIVQLCNCAIAELPNAELPLLFRNAELGAHKGNCLIVWIV
jgi:hypothetical protein